MKPIKKESAAYKKGYAAGLKAANERIRNVIFDDRLQGNELAGVYYALDREFFTAEAVISDASDALQKVSESREYYALLRSVLASADTKLVKTETALQAVARQGHRTLILYTPAREFACRFASLISTTGRRKSPCQSRPSEPAGRAIHGKRLRPPSGR